MAQRVTRTNKPEPLICRLEVAGPLDRAGIEAFRLELRRLLRNRGVELTDIRVEPARAV